MNSIQYSRGKNQYDNAPVQLEVGSFEKFTIEYLNDRAIKKGQQYICGPLKKGKHHNETKYPLEGHYRLLTHAGDRRFLCQDADGYKDANAFKRHLEHIKAHSCFVHTTWRHTDGIPRARIIYELSRPVNRAEGVQLGLALEVEQRRALGGDFVKFDKSTYNNEQPCFCAPRQADTWVFTGAAIDVDSLLAEFRPKTKIVSGSTERMLSHLLSQPKWTGWPESKIEEGNRNSTMLSFIGHNRVNGCSTGEIAKLAFEANFQRFAQPLPIEEVQGLLVRYGQGEAETKEIVVCEWEPPTPLPPKYPVPPKMDCRVLPEPFKAYVEDCANRMQVPPEMIATPLLISFGSVIGKKVAVQPKQQDSSWFEYPNLWGVSILPPAMLKSPAMKAGLYFIHELEHSVQLDYLKQHEIWLGDEQIRKLKAAEAEARAKKLMKNDDECGARRALESIKQIKPPVKKRHTVTDATPEARLEILIDNPNGCLLARDEFDGHVSQMRKEGYENARAQELQFYDAKEDYGNDRISRGSSVAEGPRLAIFGNLQPAKVEKYLRELKYEGNDDGYIQRLFQLGIQPSIDADFVLTDSKPNPKAIQAAMNVFEACDNWPLPRDGLTNRIVPRKLKFSAEAQERFNNFLMSVENKLRKSGLNNPVLSSHRGKYRGTLPKLALIVALAEDPQCLEISDSALEKATELLIFYNKHAERIYAATTRGDIVSAHELLHRIKKGKVVDGFNPRDDVMRKEWEGLTKSAEVEGALSLLKTHGYIRDVEVKTEGRPKRHIFIHPSLLAPA